MLEVEVKIKADFSDLEAKLISNGFSKTTTVYEYDTYFNGDKYNLKDADKALRIRKHEDLGTKEVKYILNFKGPKIDKITMSREETQFEVPSLEAGIVVLNGLGYFEAGNVEKTRVHYLRDDIVCCLDRVTALGDFLEVEIMAEEADYADAISRVEELIDKLGFNMADSVQKSYLSMIEEN